MSRIGLLVIFLLLATLNQGCTPYNAPIVDLEQPPSQLIKTHLVEEGESLYSIAWRYDFNTRDLAAINALKKPYKIRKGQVLNLDKSLIKKQSMITKSKAKKVEPKVEDRTSSVAKKPITSQPQKKISAQKLRWQRPVKGKVVESYNPKDLRKGVVIQAVSGASVKSASQGVVVYAGDGLRDYGKLVIIKHSDYLLSAYGHNQKLLVKEGQVVDGSKVISKLGSNGRLYFEIRKDGKPINPAAYVK
jgi:lipoprotein NlpD